METGSNSHEAHNRSKNNPYVFVLKTASCEPELKQPTILELNLLSIIYISTGMLVISPLTARTDSPDMVSIIFSKHQRMTWKNVKPKNKWRSPVYIIVSVQNTCLEIVSVGSFNWLGIAENELKCRSIHVNLKSFIFPTNLWRFLVYIQDKGKNILRWSVRRWKNGSIEDPRVIRNNTRIE